MVTPASHWSEKDIFQVNQQVPKQFYDLSRYGSAAALAKIMK
jgi:hypothetical protein